MRLLRFGGLSPVSYKEAIKERIDDEGNPTFHCPPRRKGIFAFPWPHMSLFFVCWHEKGNQEVLHNGCRDFWYTGLLWTHLTSPKEDTTNIEWVGSWRQVTTSRFIKLLRDNKHFLNTTIVKTWFRCPLRVGDRFPTDPYKRGRAGFGYPYDVDDLEVFIEKKYLGRIR